MPLLPTVSATVLRPVVEYLRTRGVEARAYAQRLGIDEALLLDDAARVPAYRLIFMWVHAETLARDPDVGLHVAEHATFDSFGSISSLAVVSPTVGDGLRSVQRTTRFLTGADTYQLEVDGPHARLRRVSCFLGLMLYELGRSTLDDARVAEGLAEFDRGIGLRPTFTTYCRALARASAPVHSDEFAAALQDFMTVIDLCEGGATLASPAAEDATAMDACTRTPRAPNGTNGFWLTGGDLFAKAGEIDVARGFYDNARRSAPEDWALGDLLEARILGLEDSVERYGDDDVSNDPELSFHSRHTCVMCHGR